MFNYMCACMRFCLPTAVSAKSRVTPYRTAMSRQRFQGQAADLAAALSPVCTSTSWLRYDESKTVQGTKVMPNEINKAHDILLAAYNLNENLNFSRSLVRSAISMLTDEKVAANVFKLKDSDRDSYIDIMTTRFMNMMRAVSQSLKKGRTAKWVTQLPWMKAKVEDDAAPAPAPSSSSSMPSYTVRFDKFLRTAVRTSPGSTTTEPALKLEANAGAKDTDPVIAIWSDGWRHAIADILTRDLERMCEPPSAVAPNNSLWEGEHIETHHRLIVRKRPDRGLLISLYEQSAQVAQVKVSSFGDDEDPAAIETATNLMVKLAKMYSSGDIAKGDLLTKRDELLVTFGGSGRRRRPASKGQPLKKQARKSPLRWRTPPRPPPMRTTTRSARRRRRTAKRTTPTSRCPP